MPTTVYVGFRRETARAGYMRQAGGIEQARDLSNNQLGFRKGRSTIDAIDRVVALATDAISGLSVNKAHVCNHRFGHPERVQLGQVE